MNDNEYRAKYTPTMKYPDRAEFVKVFVYSQGAVKWTGHEPEFLRFPSTTFKGMVVEKVLDEPAYRAARLAYSNEVGRLEKLFKEELFAEHGVAENPKANKCFAIAWDYGHASGYGEVASYFDTLVDLIKD